MPDTQLTLVCNYEAMTGFCTKLNLAHAKLSSLMDDADDFLALFDEIYEGTANAEVEGFVSELKEHLDRLLLFYEKMREFMLITTESFRTSDTTMKNNMGE